MTNKKLEKALLEIFGEPLHHIFGTKIGDVKDISDVGAVGVRDAEVCPVCDQMYVDDECNCDHSSGEDEDTLCQGCGMMIVDGKCGCEHDEVCQTCGQMSPDGSASCSCWLLQSLDTCGGCGMNEATCECEKN